MERLMQVAMNGDQMTKPNRLPAIICFITLSWCHAASLDAQDTLRCMFYNVENFFDCHDNKEKDDEMFLPGGIYGWNEKRFRQKALSIAKVIMAAGEDKIPAVIGLCEVESRDAMEELIQRSPLSALEYEYVMTESPDKRGINIAMMYQRAKFRLIKATSIRIPLIDNGLPPTRDILHCCGMLGNKDTLDLLICHMPSRFGGADSQKARKYAFAKLRHAIDSLSAIGRKNIMLMGDFNANAEETEKSLANKVLTNLISAELKNTGSYKYHGRWETIDLIFVSSDLTKQTRPTHVAKHGIFSAPFLLERDDKYLGIKPFRTYYGMKYIGGFSDHLPVYADLVVTKD